MDKGQGLHSFWSSLSTTSGVPVSAYEENSVPDDAQYPYVTYQKMSGSLEDRLSLTGSIWTRSTSWEQADELEAQLEKKFIRGGVIIRLDDGYLYIAKGSPFAQGMSDDTDKVIKRYVINLAVEYLTAY